MGLCSSVLGHWAGSYSAQASELTLEGGSIPARCRHDRAGCTLHCLWPPVFHTEPWHTVHWRSRPAGVLGVASMGVSWA